MPSLGTRCCEVKAVRRLRPSHRPGPHCTSAPPQRRLRGSRIWTSISPTGWTDFHSARHGPCSSFGTCRLPLIRPFPPDINIGKPHIPAPSGSDGFSRRADGVFAERFITAAQTIDRPHWRSRRTPRRRGSHQSEPTRLCRLARSCADLVHRWRKQHACC